MKKFTLTKKSHIFALEGIKKYRKIIEQAKSKTLNESDTSNVVNDIL
jgi:hypothetical protein